MPLAKGTLNEPQEVPNEVKGSMSSEEHHPDGATTSVRGDQTTAALAHEVRRCVTAISQAHEELHDIWHTTDTEKAAARASCEH